MSDSVGREGIGCGLHLARKPGPPEISPPWGRHPEIRLRASRSLPVVDSRPNQRVSPTGSDPRVGSGCSKYYSVFIPTPVALSRRAVASRYSSRYEGPPF
jgi:hypothetical protein